MLPFLLFVFILIIWTFLFFHISSPIFRKKCVFRIKTKNKVLALTFDDGPNGDFTLELLKILKKYNTKATFFQVGENIEKFPQITKRIFEEGHIIGNHLFTHPILTLCSAFTFEKELIKTQEIIQKVGGKKPRFFRPPRFLVAPKMFKIAKKHNLLIIGGTFGVFFEQFQPNSDFMTWEVLKKIYPGIILIFHDGFNNKGANRTNTIRAVGKIIPKILEMGYKILPLSTLLNINPYQ